MPGFLSKSSRLHDCAWLAQQLLKCTVKLRMQVYSSRIATLESRVLLDSRPKASLTKELHLLSNDLKRE